MRKRKQPKTILAWHFVGSTLRDGRPVPANGVWLRREGECVMCTTGLHASRQLIDALTYAPGNTLCRVECVEIEEEQSDKLVCHARKILARFDAADFLREAARKFALDVVHLWDAPDVVIKFLQTGDKTLQAAARAAAWGTTVGTARGAAALAALRAACSDAPRGTVLVSARDAVWAATLAAAGRGTWDSVRKKQNEWITLRALGIIRKLK